jgi:peptidoglycan hydrolase CwlO-like protein
MNFVYVAIIVAIITFGLFLATFKNEKNTTALGSSNSIVLMDSSGNLSFQPLADVKNAIDTTNNTLLGKIDSTWNHASNAQNRANDAHNRIDVTWNRANDAHGRIDQTWNHASGAHNRINETNNNLNNYVKYNDELGISSKDSKSGGEGERWIGRWGDTIKTLDPNGRDTLISSATRFKISKNPPS